MRIPVVFLVFGFSALTAIPVFIHARRFGRRSPAFDALIAAFIPVLGIVMYVSSIRLGLTPPPPDPELRHEPEPPSGSLVSELTAEIRRLRAELDATKEELARFSAHPPGE